MSTFPPPRFDITSKTWPSFADMLLRRWREGEHLGRVFFCAPPSQLGLAGGHPPLLRRCGRSHSAVPRLGSNFLSPTLFIDFDLCDSVM